MRRKASAAAVLVLLAGWLYSTASCTTRSECGGSPIQSASAGLINGSPLPGVLPLRAGQLAALGGLRGSDVSDAQLCTAVLITPELVLSAAHCSDYEPLTFSLDLASGRKPVVVDVLETIEHPNRDVMLARIDRTDQLAQVEPIAVSEALLDLTWLGSVAQLAGVGLNAELRTGKLGFLAEAIEAIDADTIRVDGGGHSGACAGDSGGPLLTRGSDGHARIIGVLSRGSRGCLGEDVFERVDVLTGWLAEQGVTAMAAPAADCDGVGKAGLCHADRSVHCEGGALRVESCLAPTRCGWSAAAHGYRCVIPSADPCRGVAALGECRGHRALRCDAGILIESECPCGSSCRRSPYDGVSTCLQD